MMVGMMGAALLLQLSLLLLSQVFEWTCLLNMYVWVCMSLVGFVSVPKNVVECFIQ